MAFGTILATKPRHGFAEIHDPVVRRRAGADEIDNREFGVFLKQHGNCACALSWLTAGTARVFGDVSANDDRLAAGAIKCQMTNRTLHAVYAAEAGMLEFRHLAAARYWRSAACLQCPVHHALNDDRAGRVVGAGFGAQAQELHSARVDVVLVNQANDGCRGHGVDTVIRTAYAKTAPHYLTNLGPLVARPVAPILQPHLIRWDIGGEAADSDGFCLWVLVHRRDMSSPGILEVPGVALNYLLHGADERTFNLTRR